MRCNVNMEAPPQMRFAEVLFDLSLDKGFDYEVPPHLAGKVHPGSRVRVSLRSREISGYVFRMKSESAFPGVKPILGLDNEHQQIPDALLKLGEWIADYYCAPMEHTLRILLPAVVRAGEMNHRQLIFVSLTAKGLMRDDDAKLTERQLNVLRTLRKEGPMPLNGILDAAQVSSAVVSALCDKGYLSKEKRVVERSPFMDDVVQMEPHKELTEQQQTALDVIKPSIKARDAQVILLKGVTASGKTEVYLQAIQYCLDLGLDAIVLVPEISLTPQTCDRFRRRFGNMVSVMHSSLSDGERFDEWTRINEGRSRIAVGARSALFAPFRKLGLIVVDEEHEQTYKQDESPRYNARDVAVVRGKMEHATVLLGSATPSMESYYNCQRGMYRLVEMPKRMDGMLMPSIELIDMGREAAETGHADLFSRRLKEQITNRIYSGEQVMLFLNRRGYATQLICPQCGYVSMCSNCSIAHTYHRKDNLLVCHLCGEEKNAPQHCPQCGSDAIKYTGVGTEKIESIVQGVFPMARVERMDSDTMSTKDAYRKVLDRFRAGKIDILIGTQMIAKGLDFPNVTLVGVIQADSSLHIPDFRSGERTFQLITQVAGRAGRGDKPGTVLVQTFTPFHPALQAAREQDYTAFYNEEIESRRMLDFPPVSHMAIVHFRSTDEEQARQYAEAFAEEVKQQLDSDVKVIGPMPSPIARVKTYYRWQLLLRGGSIRRLVRVLRQHIVGVQANKKVEVYADIDPRNLQ